jgi:hypothetical protein
MTEPPQHPTPKKQRGRARQAAPYVSKRPWGGFTAHDSPRIEPLRQCPSLRCRRVKQCLAALDNLYCLRTHHGLRELTALARQSPLQRELDCVPAVFDETDLAERMERVALLAEIHRAHEGQLLAQWQAGALDHRYGPYKRAGVIMTPPPKNYAETRKPFRSRGPRRTAER